MRSKKAWLNIRGLFRLLEPIRLISYFKSPDIVSPLVSGMETVYLIIFEAICNLCKWCHICFQGRPAIYLYKCALLAVFFRPPQQTYEGKNLKRHCKHVRCIFIFQLMFPSQKPLLCMHIKQFESFFADTSMKREYMCSIFSLHHNSYPMKF